MTTEELRELVAKSKNFEFYNNLQSVITIDFVDYRETLTGITALWEFLSSQIALWETKGNKLPPDFLQIRTHFNAILTDILNGVNQLERTGSGWDSNTFKNNTWNQITNRLNSRANGFFLLAEMPETNFLIEVFQNYPSGYKSALGFITKNNNQLNYNDRESLIGCLMAYEFIFRDKSLITERTSKEKSSLKEVKRSFESYLTKSETIINEFLKNGLEKQTDFSNKIDLLKSEKETLVNTWFEETKKTYDKQNKDATKKIEDLEKTYAEKLKLEEPAKYWNDRSIKLKKQGWIAFGFLVFFILVIAVSLGFILCKAPEEIYSTYFGKDKSAAIRWSIVYITLISLFAFSLKSIAKIMFSSFHLARDCEERYTLTYFYLSLLSSGKVDEKDRNLIIQSLFSRAETGLLKDDGSPTMPTDLVSSIIKTK